MLKENSMDYRDTRDDRIDEILQEEKFVNEEIKRKFNAFLRAHRIIDQLVELRKTKNLSQKQLSEIIGVTQQEISRLESKKNMPNLETIIQVANGLGCEVCLIPGE